MNLKRARAGLVSKAGAGGPHVNGSQLWFGVVDNVHEALSHAVTSSSSQTTISLLLDGRHVMSSKAGLS